MIARDLLSVCTSSGVARVIAEMANCPSAGVADLEKRCTALIAELKADDDYIVFADSNFCFVAVPTDKYETLPYVALTHLDELAENNYDITAVAEFAWYWGQFLGTAVDEESYRNYGADVLLGGILYPITYYDRTEAEIAPIRHSLEKETDWSTRSQTEFYAAVNHKLCEQS